MKAKELMIGNLVNYDGDPVKVIGVKSDIIYVLDPEEESSPSYEFTPIPLTPEILEKAHFVLEKGGEYHTEAWCKGNNARFDMWFKDGKFYMKSRYENEHLVLSAHHMPHIQYLHQYQNLYQSLTGEPIGITL